jgi:presequence protease
MTRNKQNRKNAIGIFTTLLIVISFTMNGFGQTTTHGFKLIEKRFVKEVNSECYYYEHVKSGATLLKIANQDENKTFAIAFKTLPNSDNGVAHVIEHSVLNGSTNFPVKSPFDILSKGSLNTFLNAMTSRDLTEFPMASLNEKDYFNLMHVYLDAVFNPLIYSDPRILKQEGWHYELTSKEAPLTYKGVVYNEMKGAFSDPQRLLLYYNLKSLFPDNPIGKESGGIPASIVTLTQKEFTDFHKKYYHPSNCIIMLYGNADMDKELAFIDSYYLSKYTRDNSIIKMDDQKPFASMQEMHNYYPIVEGAPIDNQTYMTLNFAAGSNTDYALVYALNILCEVLVNQESAPVKIALLKEGVGQDVAAYVMDFKQNALTIMLQNANPEDKNKFKEIVFRTLKEELKKGIDKKEIQAVLNRMEFNIREGSDAQKGITYFSQIKPGWLYAGNPFMGLEYEKMLETLKKGLSSGYYENLVQQYILDNNHASLVVLEPKPGMEKEMNDKMEKELQQYKSTLSDSQIENLVKKTQELIAYQNEEESPEDMAKVPMLSISDINPKATYYQCEEKVVGKTKVLHYNEFANNIIYSNVMFNMKTLPQDLIPYASLLSNVLGILNTQNYSYGDLNRELNNQTGNFNTSLRTYPENNDDNKMLAYFTLSSKILNNKSDKMFDLAIEVLLKSNLSDTARLKEVIMRHIVQLESFINNGYAVATSRTASYFTNQGVFDELTSGLDYYRFVNLLGKDIDKNMPLIVENLKKTAKLLFSRENMMAAVTCSNPDYTSYSASLKSFMDKLPAATPVYQKWTFTLTNKNEGIQAASKVQYVIAGYDFKKLGYSWDGKMRVLSQIISTDWLKNQIRVIGGAYGGFCHFSPNGTVTFNSYRDPNLMSTLETYKKTAAYLSEFNADKEAMTRYIIGTIADLDFPQTIEQKGLASFTYKLSNRTEADLQKDRTAILNTTAADIRSYAGFVENIIGQNSYCVYGNSDQILKDKAVFKNIFNIKEN